VVAFMAVAAAAAPDPGAGPAPAQGSGGDDPISAAPAPTTTTTAPATTTTATAAPTTTTTAPPRSFTMVFTGDFLLHQRVTSVAAALADGQAGRSYDFRPLLEPIRPWVEGADWAVCHMETPLSADGTRLRSYPSFRVPGQIAFDAGDVGFDSCSLASNHTLDQGADGVAETLGVLDDAGLRFTGAARSAREATDQIWLDIAGVRVAHLSYTYGFNGYRLPDDAPWTSNPIDEEQILTVAARARDDGAELIVLSLHWGEEYQHPPNSQQADLGPRLLASPDIDLIIGHHAHVIQPIDRIGGEWLVYGLGNLLSNTQRAAGRDELLVEVTASERPDGSFATELEVVPLYADPVDMAVYPSSPDPAASDPLAAELSASWDRVIGVLETGSGWGRFELSVPPPAAVPAVPVRLVS
jgi:poly-gamma-glutamate synthesis protein (capsule biosynthesis protein)